MLVSQRPQLVNAALIPRPVSCIDPVRMAHEEKKIIWKIENRLKIITKWPLIFGEF